MSGPVEMRLAREEEGSKVLAFIEEMGFSPRTPATWHVLKMGAMVAWGKGGQVMGAVPFEPREVVAGASASAEDGQEGGSGGARGAEGGGGEGVGVWHETCVAVREELRGGGVGSRLQEALAEEARRRGVSMLTVYREQPESSAYRWYVKCGFRKAVGVESYFLDEVGRYAGYPVKLEAHPVGGFAEGPGLVRRAMSPWLAVHPYRGRYNFYFAEHAAVGRVLLGVGRMHATTLRADVLRWEGEVARLLPAVAGWCAREGWGPLRWPVAVTDPAAGALAGLGLEGRWGFDLLVKELDGRVDTSGWRYAGIDFA